MRSSYRKFLEGFVSEQGHLALVEENDGVWKNVNLLALDGRSAPA